MGNSNKRYNDIKFKEYKEQLKALTDDLQNEEMKILTKSVNKGLAFAKDNTPVDTGNMKKSWYTKRARRISNGYEKPLNNSADYSMYVDVGHRIVTKGGETVGFVKGKYITDRTIHIVQKSILDEYKKSIRRLQKKYDK